MGRASASAGGRQRRRQLTEGGVCGAALGDSPQPCHDNALRFALEGPHAPRTRMATRLERNLIGSGLRPWRRTQLLQEKLQGLPLRTKRALLSARNPRRAAQILEVLTELFDVENHMRWQRPTPIRVGAQAHPSGTDRGHADLGGQTTTGTRTMAQETGAAEALAASGLAHPKPFADPGNPYPFPAARETPSTQATWGFCPPRPSTMTTCSAARRDASRQSAGSRDTYPSSCSTAAISTHKLTTSMASST